VDNSAFFRGKRQIPRHGIKICMQQNTAGSVDGVDCRQFSELIIYLASAVAAVVFSHLAENYGGNSIRQINNKFSVVSTLSSHDLNGTISTFIFILPKRQHTNNTIRQYKGGRIQKSRAVERLIFLIALIARLIILIAR